MKNKCAKCGKLFVKALVLSKDGKPLPVDFCCYKHYLEFWKGTAGFKPLKKFSK